MCLSIILVHNPLNLKVSCNRTMDKQWCCLINWTNSGNELLCQKVNIFCENNCYIFNMKLNLNLLLGWSQRWFLFRGKLFGTVCKLVFEMTLKRVDESNDVSIPKSDNGITFSITVANDAKQLLVILLGCMLIIPFPWCSIVHAGKT